MIANIHCDFVESIYKKIIKKSNKYRLLFIYLLFIQYISNFASQQHK